METLNHRSVAKWTGLDESTLSKRSKGRDRQQVWAEALRASASKVHVPGADLDFAFASPAPVSAPTPKVQLNDVLQILEFLARGESVKDISQRSGLSLPLCETVNEERMKLSAKRIGVVEELHWGTPKLAAVLQVTAGSPVSELVTRAARACVDLAVGEYIDATIASRLDPVLRLLRHAHLLPALMLVRSDNESAAEVQEVIHLIALRFGARPAFESVQRERTTRPPVRMRRTRREAMINPPWFATEPVAGHSPKR